MTWIKICGTTSLADAECAVAAGADALGFIFAPSTRGIEPEKAAEIIAALPGQTVKIGVFVNESPARVAELAAWVGLTGVQLHGDEPPGRLAEFRSVLGARKIIKTLQARELLAGGATLLEEYLRVARCMDGVLIDSGSAARRGGTGVPFNWNAARPLVSRIKEVVPVIISGGLTPENVTDAVRLFQPWGVDVLSGVEREVGKKDEAKLRAFVKSVREVAAGDSAQGEAASGSNGARLSTR